ncbi:MAG: PAC2 family protein [Candidatus Heimdallarchaeota archaeon]|nr:PAC2 family protein [Candidatus Heimdallarchaeota archaeon]
MKNSTLFLNQMSLDTSIIDSDTTVILGFTGYGSVGTTVLNHLVEETDVNSVGFWGTMSWFHKDNIEAPITVYSMNPASSDDKEKVVLVASRLPIPVVGYDALPDAFWKWLSQEILSWNAKRYIIIGGLREDVRDTTDDSWIALVPTKKYTEVYGTKRTFRDDLSIRGPISFLLTEGTAYSVPVLAVLSYCNTFDIDYDAALMALKEVETHINRDFHSNKIIEFDISFLETQIEFYQDTEEKDFDDFDDFENEEDFEDFENDSKEGDSKEGNSKNNSSFDSRSISGKYRNKKDDLERYR